MHELVERVAKAIACCVYTWGATTPDYWDNCISETDKDGFRTEARAAIEALRELPENPGPRYRAGEYSRRTQEAMVDDALNRWRG